MITDTDWLNELRDAMDAKAAHELIITRDAELTDYQ